MSCPYLETKVIKQTVIISMPLDVVQIASNVSNKRTRSSDNYIWYLFLKMTLFTVNISTSFDSIL